MPPIVRGRPILWLVTVAFGLWPLIGFSQPAPPLPAQPLEQILFAVSNPAPQNLKLAEQAWQTLGGTEASVLTKYAMALAYARNNQVQKGLDLIESLPIELRQGGPLRRFDVWLMVRLRKDEAAQLRLEEFVADLKLKSAAAPTPANLEDVAFLSKLVTYLEQVDARDKQLTPRQAQAWQVALDGLPVAWKADLGANRDALTAEFKERTEFVKKNYDAWRAKTANEMAITQNNVAMLRQQEMAASAQLKIDADAYQAFIDQNVQRVTQLEGQLQPLVRQRQALRKPSRPDDRSTTGVKDSNQRREIERQNDRAKTEYNRDLTAYERERKSLDAQIGPLQATLGPIYQQRANLETKAEKQGYALKKIQKPLGEQTKNEQRLTKQLADQPAWDSPAGLGILRALDTYSVISFPAEVDRIRRK